MIWDVVIIFASGIASLLTWIISRVTLAMPDQFQQWLSYVFGYANVFKGVIAVSDLMSAVIVILTAYAVKFGIVLFFKFVWPLIPYFGKSNIEPFIMHGYPLPNEIHKAEIDQHSNKYWNAKWRKREGPQRSHKYGK